MSIGPACASRAGEVPKASVCARFPSASAARRLRGFSLLEMAVAVALVILLFGVGLFAGRGPLERARLESGAESVEAAVLLARASAASESEVMEIVVVPADRSGGAARVVVRRAGGETSLGGAGVGGFGSDDVDERGRGVVDGLRLPGGLEIVEQGADGALEGSSTERGLGGGVGGGGMFGGENDGALDRGVRVAFVLPDGSVVAGGAVVWRAGRDTERVSVDARSGRVVRRAVDATRAGGEGSDLVAGGGGRSGGVRER